MGWGVCLVPGLAAGYHLGQGPREGIFSVQARGGHGLFKGLFLPTSLLPKFQRGHLGFGLCFHRSVIGLLLSTRIILQISRMSLARRQIPSRLSLVSRSNLSGSHNTRELI